MQNSGPILLSVIVPAYNVMDCLERCIRSLTEQTIKNIEIIIVDDGSTDNTGALAEKMALMDKRIRVFHKENGGSSSARNVGIDAARGEYIGFVDADDYVDKAMYERLLRVAMQEKFLMVQTSRDEINEDGTRRPDVCTPPENAKVVNTVFVMRELLLHKGDCSFCTRITHRSCFSKLRFPEGELNEDFYLLVQMLNNIKEVAVLPNQDYHVVYRMGSNSRTDDENRFPKVFTDIVVNADRVYKIVDDNYPMLIEEAQRFGLYQRLDYMLHIPIKMMCGKNDFYKKVRKYLHANRFKAFKNKYLTDKEKKYIFILGTCPKMARRIHKLKMKAKKTGKEV